MRILDDLDRTSKLLVDQGIAESFDDAANIRNFSIHIRAHKPDSADVQAAILTAVATAHRAFGGRITYSDAVDSPCLAIGFTGLSVREACRKLGASTTVNSIDLEIVIGNDPMPPAHHSPKRLYTSICDWVASVGPDPFPRENGEGPWFVGVAAGALAVSEGFRSLIFKERAAGVRVRTIDLWNTHQDYSSPCILPVPSLSELMVPEELWLIGLGHLGQAYLWTGLLKPGPPLRRIVLQDTDRLVKANISTGLLTGIDDIGKLKTRHLARVIEENKISSTIIERRFDEYLRRRKGLDPSIVLLGVDNVETRRHISNLETPLLIDVGLGARHNNYNELSMRCFPDCGSSHEVQAWQSDPLPIVTPSVIYAELDQCGQLLLANKAVGVAFVGALASAVVWAELVRRTVGVHSYRRVDLKMSDNIPTQVTPVEGNHNSTQWGTVSCFSSL